jgi:integrase
VTDCLINCKVGRSHCAPTTTTSCRSGSTSSQPSARWKLSKLDTPNIQALYSAKLHDGLKPSSVRYIHAVLHRALSKAVELRLIARNPAASADPPKVRHEEITPLSMDQTRAFLDAARGHKYEALYVLYLTCGLRMGESLGLKWSDINLDAGTLRVNRQLQRIREGGGLVFSEPKNASRRTIDLPQRALEALRLHSKRQAEVKRGPCIPAGRSSGRRSCSRRRRCGSTTRG